MKKIVQAFILITVGTTMLTTSVFSASAHYLNDWANKYTWEAADTTNSFTINYSYHMDGNTTNYYFANSVAESYFATPIKQGFTMWGDLISGTKTAALSAHTKMSYAPGASPGGHPAIEWSRAGDGNHHFRRGYNDAEIIFYKEATTYTATEKNSLQGMNWATCGGLVIYIIMEKISLKVFIPKVMHLIRQQDMTGTPYA